MDLKVGAQSCKLSFSMVFQRCLGILFTYKSSKRPGIEAVSFVCGNTRGLLPHTKEIEDVDIQ